MTSTQHVRVEGTSYQRGRQYGGQAAARVRLSVQAYQQTFAHFAGWDWPTVRREALRFEAPIGDFRPAYLDELRGIADGAGLDLADVLAINVRTEVMYSAKARQAPTSAKWPAECSAFAVVPAPGQKGPGDHRAELGLAPARRSDAGRAGGPPGRRARTSSPWSRPACSPRPG